MNQVLFYLIQVIAASGLLYGYYHFALRNKRFHRYNRFYLLMAVLIITLIPFLNIPVYFSENETSYSAVLETLQVISSPMMNEPIATIAIPEDTRSTWITTEKSIYLLYCLILLFFIARIFISLNKIRYIIKRNPVERIDKIKLVYTEEQGTPFSFFRWLFWNKKLELHSEKGEQIFRHELFHIQQKHSWDIIFMEVVTTIFWINPFFHLMKRELKAIHEFLADEFAIKENRRWQYAELLLMQVLHTNTHLVNPFFHNPIKRRIAMITTSTKPSYQYLRKVMVLPLSLLIAFLCAFSYKKTQVNDVPEIHTAEISKVNPQFSPDTSKLLNNALIIINGVTQEMRGIQNIDTTRFPKKEFTGKIETVWGKEAIEKYGEKGRDGVVEIYFDTQKSKTNDTIPKIDTVLWEKNYSKPAKKSPTAEDLKTWQDPKMYGVWLDGTRIANSELAEYKPADLDLYYVSKLEKNAVNYGKHYYQVCLYSPAYYKKNINGVLIRETYLDDTTSPQKMKEPLIVINGKVMAGLDSKKIDEVISPNDIESINVLKDKTATEKYGEKGKYGVIEIKTKMKTINETTGTDKKFTGEDDNLIFEKVEIEPAFKGGYKAWKEFCEANLNGNIPIENKAPAGTYMVVLRFIVDKDGTISDLEPLTKLGYGMEEESIRVMKLSPKWKPAIQNGYIVKAYRKQPFNFVVNKK